MLGALALLGCGNQPKVRTLRLSARSIPTCSLDRALAHEAWLELTPLGDLPREDATPARTPLLGSADLDLPPSAAAVAASVEVAGQRFIGYAERDASDALDILFWPAARGCQLDDATPLVAVESGRALGYSRRTRRALLAGGEAPGYPAASVAAYTFDAASGELSELAAALSEPRAHATVTGFGDKFLIAGGENPLRGASEELAPPSATADVFDPVTRNFQAPIALNVERTRHSAIELASGDTLLVGGRGPRATPLNVLELVSSASGHASIAGLASLQAARLAPALLALDDGRLFVGGGTANDGTPLAALEWLSGDAREHLASVLAGALPPRHDRAFIALPGGGVLAVGGCQVSEVPCGGDCRAGCPPTDLSGGDEPRYDAWWISEQGDVAPVELPVAAPRPLLFGGADGAPLLATGASDERNLWRFDPWQARFELAPLTLTALPRAGDGQAALADQAVLWTSDDEEGAHLVGLRWGTRDHLAIDPPLVTSDGSDGLAAPFPLVPDRPTAGHVRFQRSERILIFDAESEARVFVASADYGALSVELWVEGDAPRVILGDQEYGGEACPWPRGDASIFKLERDSSGVTLSSGGALAAPCPAPAGRVRLGVARGDGAMVVRRISVERRPDANLRAQ